jgi:Zn-dependent membrane protease YugP
MPYLLLTAFIALLVYLPSLWIRLALKRHGQPREDLPGTGAELATHLIKRFELDGVGVEETTTMGDHYDPQASMVRLSSNHFNGKSIAAVAVAAHEVGHAIQFHRQEAVSRLRMRYIPLAMGLKKAGVLIITLLPLIAILVRVPAAIFAVIAVSIALQLLGALAYLIVLPEEWDASFRKALPILVEGEYLDERDLPAARQVLKAAAFTYFASALADLVNIGRWLLILRR